MEVELLVQFQKFDLMANSTKYTKRNINDIYSGSMVLLLRQIILRLVNK